MKVTVFHNDARGSMFDGFVRKDAALLKVAEFETDRELAPFAPAGGVRTLETIQAELDAHDAQFIATLNEVFEQLNVGGDMIPATEYTQAYRAAGHRSLSVGDVVEVEGRPYAVDRIGFKRIMNAEVRWGVIRYDRLADPETKMWRMDIAEQVNA